MRRILVIALAVACMWCGSVTRAVAAGVILGFAETYRAADGTVASHRGVDVAHGGESVSSLVAGEVRFAGRVPAAGGGTVCAVTIECTEGLVTLMPLISLSVEAGERVESGGAIGALADSGDASSGIRHLHLSLRRGGVYVDPSVLLSGIVASPGEFEEEPAPVPVSAPTVPVGAIGAPVSLGHAAAPRVTVTRPGSAADVPAVRIGDAEPSSQHVAEATTPRGRIAPVTPAARPAELAPGVSLASPVAAPGLAASADSAALVGWSRAMGQAVALIAAVPPTAGLVVLATAAAFSFTLLARRGFARRVTSSAPVSDRLGMMLQALRAGDTLYGLTSCPGLLPSQSRGRLAQRR